MTVFVDSYIVLACASGYVNNGGSLNVTCLNTGSWTTYPNCVQSNTGVTTTTTAPPPSVVGCPIDAATTFTIANGYFTSQSLSYTSSTAAIGKCSH